MDHDYGPDYIFTNNDDYTHAVIINTAMPKLAVSKENVIGLAFEPIEYLGLTKEFIEYAGKYIGKYFIGTKYNLPEPFIEYFSFMWHCTPITREIINKTKIMSIIFSEKQNAPGHKYRYELIQKILETNLPIDIYGRGCNILKHVNDERLKGTFSEMEPYIDYKYHIAIENFRHQSYISEKFMNALICKCIPVYYGAYNIDAYFPKSCIKLSGNIIDDIKLISEICFYHINDTIITTPYNSNMKLTNLYKNKTIK
jgi:hypothetical protein